MSIEKKLKKLLTERIATKQDKKKIAEFIQILKDKNIKILNDEKLDKIMDETNFGSSFIFDFWPQIAKDVKKAGIKLNF